MSKANKTRSLQSSLYLPHITGQESENRFTTVKLGKYDKTKKIIHTRITIKPTQGSRTGRLDGDMSQVYLITCDDIKNGNSPFAFKFYLKNSKEGLILLQ